MDRDHQLLPVGTNELAIGVVSERTRYMAVHARRLYDWVVERQGLLGLSPDVLSVWAPTYPKAKYRGFARGRAKLEHTDFAVIKSIHLDCKRDDWSDQDQENRKVGWYIRTNSEWPLSDRAYWMFDRASCGLSQQEILEQLGGFAREAVDTYGYIYIAPRKFVITEYGMGVGISAKCCPTVEEATNMGGGLLRYDEMVAQGAAYLLRDVHMVTFLSRPYLEQPVERTTLERWIKQDDERGSLEPFTEKIWQWTPPPARIPVIRERLFRAGLLYYYRFFRYWEKDNPWVRDFSKPFVCPDEVPDIFRSTYRRVIDPPIAG